MEGIVEERENLKTGTKEYKVKWIGWKNCTWQQERDLDNAPEIIKEWNKKKKLQLVNTVDKKGKSKQGKLH